MLPVTGVPTSYPLSVRDVLLSEFIVQLRVYNVCGMNAGSSASDQPVRFQGGIVQYDDGGEPASIDTDAVQLKGVVEMPVPLYDLVPRLALTSQSGGR